MRPPNYDFLANEDREWIARCRILAAVLFLGLTAGVALYDDDSVKVTETSPTTAKITTAAALAAAPSVETATP